uniref:Uncharacterized protein LOC100185227 n=1 Tax=Phallusia mammillata TaxID=59560 RepID=A0A6F9DIY8_9ASCI|nr:uncharacterized protein LOC100185227 [Phallusia mammillata]
MNPVFRRGYRNLFFLIFTCKRAKKISSAGLHASQHSDSFYKSKRRSSAPSTPNSRLAVTKPSPLLVTIGRRSLPQNFLADTRSSIAATPQMTPKSSNNNGNLQFNRRPTSTNIDTPKHFGRGSDAQTRQNSEEPPPAPSHPSQSPKYKSGKAGPASVAAFRRPHSLLRREKRPAQVDKKVAELEREARLKRNSLMLLQIQMSDDEDEGSPVVHRRTRSEIPNGTLKRLIQPPSSNSMNNLSGDAFLDTPTATKCSTESDMSHDEKSPKQDATPQNDSMQIEVPVVRRESAV